MADVNWLFFSDMQVPYQDQKAVDLVFKVGRWLKPDVVVNIGDLSDQAGVSRFNEGTADEVLIGLKEENIYVQKYWQKVDKVFPNARKIWTLGNHDIRYRDYLSKKAPALLEIVTPEVMWKTDTYGVELYEYAGPPQVKMNEVYVHHGIAVSKHSGESAKQNLESLGVSLISGHTHRAGSVYKTYELEARTLQGHEIGHLCNPKSEGFLYSHIHNWQQAFAIGFQSDDGVTDYIQVVRIYPDYTCYVGNKKFSL